MRGEEVVAVLASSGCAEKGSFCTGKEMCPFAAACDSALCIPTPGRATCAATSPQAGLRRMGMWGRKSFCGAAGLSRGSLARGR